MNPTVLRIEAGLARAHRQLYTAHELAESMRDQGFADDLWALMLEIERLQTSLLTARKRAPSHPAARVRS